MRIRRGCSERVDGVKFPGPRDGGFVSSFVWGGGGGGSGGGSGGRMPCPAAVSPSPLCGGTVGRWDGTSRSEGRKGHEGLEVRLKIFPFLMLLARFRFFFYIFIYLFVYLFSVFTRVRMVGWAWIGLPGSSLRAFRIAARVSSHS